MTGPSSITDLMRQMGKKRYPLPWREGIEGRGISFPSPPPLPFPIKGEGDECLHPQVGFFDLGVLHELDARSFQVDSSIFEQVTPAGQVNGVKDVLLDQE